MAKKYSPWSVIFGRVLPSELIKPEFQEWFWKNYADTYPDLIYARPYKDLLDVFVGMIGPAPGAKVLDVGCSNAYLSTYLYLNGLKMGKEHELAEIHGADIIRPSFLETEDAVQRRKWLNRLSEWLVGRKYLGGMARNMAWLERETSVMPFKYCHLDLADPPYGCLAQRQDYYDLIVSNMVLTYIPWCGEYEGVDALRAIFRELRKSLKPGGRIVWSTPRWRANFLMNFVASSLDMMTLNHEGQLKLLHGVAIVEHALIIQKQGNQRIYNMFEPNPQIGRKTSPYFYDDILRAEGFEPRQWKLSFTGQAWVNEAVRVD